MKDYHCLMSIIATFNVELNVVCHEFKSLSKSMKMLTSVIHSMDSILNDEKSIGDKKGLRFSEKVLLLKNLLLFLFMPQAILTTLQNKLYVLKEECSAVKTKIQIVFNWWICHFYDLLRPVRLYFYCLHGYCSNKRSVSKNDSNFE